MFALGFIYLLAQLVPRRLHFAVRFVAHAAVLRPGTAALVIGPTWLALAALVDIIDRSYRLALPF